MTTVLCSISFSVRQGSNESVKFFIQSIAIVRFLQYLLKTVSKSPVGLAFSISSSKTFWSMSPDTHVKNSPEACFFNEMKE